MDDPGRLSIDLRGIAHILRDRTLEVPPFQRNYAWGEEQVMEYWYDLQAALVSDQAFYFMGTVVLGEGTAGRVSVIDGQQRLATTSILLAAIRDLFRRFDDPSRADTIQAQYLAAPSLLENRIVPKLVLNQADRPYFNQRVLGIAEPDVTERTDIERAYAIFLSLLSDDVAASGPNWESRLLKWVNMLEKTAQVITVSVADDSDAFMIFETLNDRGLELSVADVIKNYLLGLTRDRISEAQSDWLTAAEAMEEASQPRELTTFIRHWWSSRQGATRERDLYRSLRSVVKSQDQSIAALDQLAKAAPAYAALLDADHGWWGSHTLRTRDAIRVLNDLGLEQYRPLALASMLYLEPGRTEDVLAAIVNWSARGLIVGGIGGGTAERFYAEAAVRVTNGRATDVSSIYKELEQMVARDTEFSKAFASRRILRTSYLRYFLRALAGENSDVAGEFEELVPVPLFPRSPSPRWLPFANQDQSAEMSARLGNFALVASNNARATPAEPSERFEYLSLHDRLSVEPDLQWLDLSPAAVDERQHRMADRAVAIWPLLPNS